MSRTIFITATDTDAGKTWVTHSLLQAMLSQGVDAQALKPVASGKNGDGLNEDVALLLDAQPSKHSQDINYVTYDFPLAPALAAKKQGLGFNAEQLLAWQDKQISQHDITLIEGVGGLMVPLRVDEKPWLVSDWIQTTAQVEVMLVVPLRLGCMSQVLTHCQCLAGIGSLPRWIVFNDMSQTGGFDETQMTLKPILQNMFAQPPNMICLCTGEGMPNIIV